MKKFVFTMAIIVSLFSLIYGRRDTFGMDQEGSDYRACMAYGPLYG